MDENTGFGVGKQIRVVLEVLCLIGCFVLALALNMGTSDVQNEDIEYVNEIPTTFESAYENNILSRSDAEGYPMVQYGEAHFSAILYPGLTTDESDDRRVHLSQFKLQMEQLSKAGYKTITPEDASAFLLNSIWPPQKAIMVILEDSTTESARLARNILLDLDYTAVLAVYASDVEKGRIPGEALRELEQTDHFVVATRGYERSYINVFGNNGSFIGKMSAEEFDATENYIADYSCSLMDFMRDSDRLPIETQAALERRITEDYRKTASVFREALGRVPDMLMLTRPNTGAFGDVQAASDINKRMITSAYTMNFNRRGSALNTQAIPIYDLSYMRVESDFSANHLMMKLWDDSADDVVFALGSPDEAAKWNVDDGIAQFDAGAMTLTTLPNASARAALSNMLLDDFELEVTLKGATAGRQSIFLRTDRNCAAGVEVCFEDDVLIVRPAGQTDVVWFRMNLAAAAGERQVSVEEAELAAQIATNEAILLYDTDLARQKEAEANLARLRRLRVRSVAEGATAVRGTISGTAHRDRHVFIRLSDDKLTLRVDGHRVVDGLTVASSGRGTVALGSGVSPAGLAAASPDDVYDGIFEKLVIRNLNGDIYYSYPIEVEISIEVKSQRWMDRLNRLIRDLL